MTLNETQTRIVTAIGLGLFSVVWLFRVSENLFIGIAVALLLLCLAEYRQIIKSKDIEVRGVILFGTGLMGFTSLYFYNDGVTQSGHMALMFTFANPVVYSLLRAPDKLRQLQILLTPLFWFVAPIFMLVYLRTTPEMPVGPKLILWMALVVAMNDVTAYFGGRRFGKTPLAPKISPKKTREGSLFGLLGGLIAGFAAQPWLFGFAQPWELLVIIVVIVPVSQAGDLAESVFKRKFGVKDSGKILPGHGGVLDRFDAMLFALPVFGLMLYFMGFAQRW